MGIKTVPIVEAEAVEQERRRQRLLALINRDGPVWRKQDHADCEEFGTTEWIGSSRNEPTVVLRLLYPESTTEVLPTSGFFSSKSHIS
jgi:hypothetical protein